jgi:adenine-specific DNA-methyltransferase
MSPVISIFLGSGQTGNLKSRRQQNRYRPYPMTDRSHATREQLLAECKERGLRGYSGKKKSDLLLLLGNAEVGVEAEIGASAGAGAGRSEAPPSSKEKKGGVTRLNYIGSKYPLLDWLVANIQEQTGWSSLAGKRIADLFAGTGIVSYHFRTLGASVLSNDAELFSSIIAHALTLSVYSDRLAALLTQLNTELQENKQGGVVGYVTTHYSPHEGNERMFFTVENAKAIDYIRARIEELRPTLTEDEAQFLLASLLVSADAVSNVPAVYGCYLKAFKDKAKKGIRLQPVHLHTVAAREGSCTFHSDVLAEELLSLEADAVYLDPPYNERQYSKNYFPLNIIAKTPTELTSEPDLKGKTGIPVDCFVSPFCKRATVEGAFDRLVSGLRAEWVFLSYNSESLVSKENMLELLGKYGTVTVVERPYKRFKSFKYNKDAEIEEYLFCLHKAGGA